MRGIGPATVLMVVAALVSGTTPAMAAGPATRGYVLERSGFTLIGFDPATNTVTDRIPLGFASFNFEIRPDGREIYVPAYQGDRVNVLSTENNTVVATVAVGQDPWGITFTPDSRKAYVASTEANTITVIDTGTHRVSSTINLGHQPGSPRISPDGTRIYVGLDDLTDFTTSVGVISTATDTITGMIPAGNGPANRVRFTPDGRFALLTSGHVIDTQTETVVRTIPLGAPTDFEFSPDGTRVYVARGCAGPDLAGEINTVDLVTGATRTVFTGDNPNDLEFTPDGVRLYVELWGRGGVAMLDSATHTVLDRFSLSATPLRDDLGGLRLSGTAPSRQPGQRFPPGTMAGSCLI